MLSSHFFQLSTAFLLNAVLFDRDNGEVVALPVTDMGQLKITGEIVKNAKAIENQNPKNPTAAATELDILMPPIEFTETIVGIADVTFALPNTKLNGKDENDHAPNWWHTCDALLVAIGMIVMALIMAFVTHCIWRRHVERRTLDGETENVRIFCGTPYYIDRSQIFVY